MKARGFSTAVTIALYIVFEAMWRPFLSQLQAVNGAKVLTDDSISGNTFSRLFTTTDFVSVAATILMLLVVVCVWRKPFKNAAKNGTFLTMLMLSLVLVGCGESGAARATTDSQRSQSSDIVEVKPNQTAFKIPATGGNESSQVQLKGIDYLEGQKALEKRITIQKDNVGQMYIPRDYVILVDHTPITRQWTTSSDTGTSSSNQALCAETNESIEVCFQISLAAVVQEKDAAKYLYNYPTLKLENPKVDGVYLGAPLDMVIDNQVRQYLQTIIGREEATRDLKGVIKDKTTIVTGAEKEAIKYFGDQGITIGYVGMGGELVFAPEIQQAINELFVATQRVQIAYQYATATAIAADAAKNAAQKRGEGDSEALAKLNQALGGNASSLGAAMEGYRWDGSRVQVILSQDTKPAIAIPVPSNTPVPAPARAQSPQGKPSAAGTPAPPASAKS